MENKIMKRIIRSMSWKLKKKSLSQVLSIRCRRENHPEDGRFTPNDIQKMIQDAEFFIKDLQPYFIEQKSIGNYQNEYVGLLDLALYRSLIKNNINKNYAIILIGDMMWQTVLNSKGLIPIIDPLKKKINKLIVRDKYLYLGKRLRDMIKYPYSEPGYQMKFYEKNNEYCMDVYTCSVYDFYKQFGKDEMNMFKMTWCTFDYTAAEHVVEGGKYERGHCLSHGDGLCDMRWFIEE